jgi:hypothetical protein
MILYLTNTLIKYILIMDFMIFNYKDFKTKNKRYVDYVTAYIKYDYKSSTTKQCKKVMILVSKIYPKKADRNILKRLIEKLLLWS